MKEARENIAFYTIPPTWDHLTTEYPEQANPERWKSGSCYQAKWEGENGKQLRNGNGVFFRGNEKIL